MKTVYIVHRKWNVCGDTGDEIVSCWENRNDACFDLANEVRDDSKHLGWFDQCEYSEMEDENDNKFDLFVLGDIPEKLSYFLIQEKEEWQGEYYEEYCVEELAISPYSTDEIMQNPFQIPNLTTMHNRLCRFISAHSLKKGFISTEDGCTTMYAMVFSDAYSEPCYHEYTINAIRARGNTIQIIYGLPTHQCNSDYISTLDDKDWSDIKYDDYIYYLPTVFSIAEEIQQFAGQE